MDKAHITKEHLEGLLDISNTQNKSICLLINEYTLNAVNYSEGFEVTKEDYQLSYQTMINKYNSK